MNEELFRTIQQLESTLTPANEIRAFIEQQGLDVDSVRAAYQAWQRQGQSDQSMQGIMGRNVRGFKRGIRDVGQGIKQGVKMVTGADDLGEYTEQVNREREEYERQGGNPVARFLGNAATTLPAMFIPGGNASLLTRLAAGAAAGGAAGAAQFAPSGTLQEKALQTGAGAVGGAVLPEAMRAALRAPAALALKMTGRTGPTPGAMERAADYSALGIQPTTAQVTRNPVAFAQERNLAQLPAGEPLAAVRSAQPGALAQRLTEVGPGQPMTPVAAGRQIQGVIGQRRGTGGIYKEMGKAIDDLYEAAKGATGAHEVLDAPAFALRVGETFSDFEDAIPSVVSKRLASFGDDRPFTVREAFKFRELLNRRSRASNDPATQEALRQIKGHLDDFLTAQPEGTGGEALNLFRQANAAAAERAKVFEAVPLKKTVNGKVAPDKFIATYIAGGNTDDLIAVKNLLTRQGGQEGVEAWNTARQQVVDYLHNQAVNDAGSFSAAQYNRALERIGEDKLAVLFNPRELTTLQRIGRAATNLLTDPPTGGIPVGNRSGTAAAVFNQGAPLWNKLYQTLRQMHGVDQALKGSAIDPLANRAASSALAGRMVAPQMGPLALNPWAPVGGTLLGRR